MTAPIPGQSSGRRKLLSSLLLALAMVPASSCSSLRVPSRPEIVHRQQLLRSEADGVTLEARPIRGTDEYWELFDDNLTDIGIAAVWVAFRNARSGAIDLSGAKLRLRIGDKRRRTLDIGEVFDTYYDRRHIRIYTLNSDREARRRMHEIVWVPGALSPNAGCEGLVFFRIDSATAANWPKGSILIAGGIRLETGRKLTLQLPLDYANP